MIPATCLTSVTSWRRSKHAQVCRKTFLSPFFYSSEVGARGARLAESDRLGDTITNGDSKTGHHNKFNRACRDAVAAKSITAVILGDKGDGSAKARAAAKAKVWTHPPKTLLRVVLSSASVLLSLS